MDETKDKDLEKDEQEEQTNEETEKNEQNTDNDNQSKGDDNSKSKTDDNSSKQDNNSDDIKAQNEKISNLESKLICYEKGVVKDSVNDVIAIAKSYVNDKTDINKAVDMVLKKYPTFANSQNGDIFDSGVKSKGGNTTLSGVEKAFYKRNPSLK